MPFEIINPNPGEELVDALNGAYRLHSKVGQHGFVDLVDIMPRLVPKGRRPDFAIVQAARTSYGDGLKTALEDRSLIRHLFRNQHTSPYEMCELKFHCSMPIFVARQWIRHRTANVNEISGRYTVLKDNFFMPDKQDICTQSKNNKQGRAVPVEDSLASEFLSYLDTAQDNYKQYEHFVNSGMAKETARMNLPLTLFTEWYWKIDLHNLLHFLSLRCDSHAQKEIRDYANPMLEMVGYLMPEAYEAFNDYHFRRGGLLLSRMEVEAIKQLLAAIAPNGIALPSIESLGKTETAEWLQKGLRLGFQKPEEKAT